MNFLSEIKSFEFLGPQNLLIYNTSKEVKPTLKGKNG
jgi:hypothetical protein